jgi:hypothetical protein
MSGLEADAQRWIEEIHPHAKHLVRARDWVVLLQPDAGEALRIAAVLHDVERAFPDPDSPWDPAGDWDHPGYLQWHQERAARIAAAWLAEQDAPPDLVDEVRRLILVHEQGGWAEADVLQAADSLSFLETLSGVTVAWVQRGVAPQRAVSKLEHMADRIRVAAARRAAARASAGRRRGGHAVLSPVVGLRDRVQENGSRRHLLGDRPPRAYGDGMAHTMHEGEHSHVHGDGCGHTAIRHDDHIDYLHDGHLHHPHGDHVDEHVIAVDTEHPEGHTDPADCADGHTHGAGCGHEAIPHGEHIDYVVEGRLHHPHDGHCDDHGAVATA